MTKAFHEFSTLPRSDLVSQVGAALTDAVLSGRIEPGQRIPESVIAREMGISRAPVREAARQLESAGLLVAIPNRGFFVREINARAMDDLYELRLAIESAAIVRLASQAGDRGMPRLRACLKRLHDTADEDAPQAQVAAADLAFHRAICEASGNERLLAAFDQIAAEVQMGLVLIGCIYGDADRVAETHRPLLDAIAAGDVEQARAAIEEHIGTARRLVVQRLQQRDLGPPGKAVSRRQAGRAR
ncbi:GntR family transcriptional regulator [Paracoccus sp. M683]|uniref:GntR family transcriptional regulator n=1 Tax=Paracoccus sp. M683 TaxID=2594268 RepID=UPI0011813D47|nr:GntR family transcriptional regulator [Paracoccus sp. M683]TRW96006.1 GntR family transcriptional regulator [Paracoccus sp. M683]